MIGSIKEDIEGGSTLTDALKKYPKIFDELFVNLVAAGESGGILDVILQRLSGYMEKAMKLKSKVKGAMTYPISVLVISIGVVAVLLLKVIPVFQKMFEGMGSALPGPTQFLVDASQFTQNYFLYHGRRFGGAHLRIQKVLRDRKGDPHRRRPDLEIPGIWSAAEESGRVQVFENPLHHDVERRSDPGRARHRQQDGGKQDHRESPS